MPFDYYRRLSPRAQRIDDAIDGISELALPRRLKLTDSLHTEGSFRRESSLFRPIAPEAAVSSRRAPGVPSRSTRSDR